MRPHAEPFPGEKLDKPRHDPGHQCGMNRTLGAHGDDKAVDQLDVLVGAEHSDFDQPQVLADPEAPRLGQTAHRSDYAALSGARAGSAVGPTAAGSRAPCRR